MFCLICRIMDDANEQQSKQKLKRWRKKTSSSRKKRAAIFRNFRIKFKGDEVMYRNDVKKLTVKKRENGGRLYVFSDVF